MIVRKTVMRKTYAPSLEMADIKGSPEDIMKLFKDEQKRVALQYCIDDPSTIEFEAEYYGYDGGTQLMVKFPRPETVKEMEARIKKEAQAEKRAAAKEARERAKYEELKAKYGE